MSPEAAEALARRLDRMEARLDRLEAAITETAGVVLRLAERLDELDRLERLRETARVTDQAEAGGHAAPKGRHDGGH